MAEHNMPTPELEGANTLISKRELQRPTLKGEEVTPKEENSSARIAPPKPKTWKDKFRESFVGNDVQTVGDYIIFSVLIPSVKNTLLSIINNGASMFLGGGPQQQSLYSNQRSNNSYVSYNYVTRNNASSYAPSALYGNSPSASGLKNISWGSELEALNVLSDLRDYIYSANQVSVAKYYTLARIPGFRPDIMDGNWGWYSLERAVVIPSPVEPGRWIIDLPKPVYLR